MTAVVVALSPEERSALQAASGRLLSLAHLLGTEKDKQLAETLNQLWWRAQETLTVEEVSA